MTRIALIALLALIPALVAAQDVKPADDVFQEVVVDGYTFAVDNQYPCTTFLVARFTHLGGETGVVSVLTWQPFYVSGSQAVAGEKFASNENELTATVEVGEDLPCAPREVAP